VDDRFDGRRIPSHWGLYHGRYGSNSRNCAAPSQDFVQNGRLVLLMSYRRHGVCGSGWYTGGMQVARRFGGVDQTVQVRFRVVATDPAHVYSHRIVPMRWPSDHRHRWYQGEGDYCEGSRLTGCSTFLHHSTAERVAHRHHSLDLSTWHVIKAVQRSHRVKVYVDGRLSWDYRGDATTVPSAFKVTVLQQECPTAGCPSPSRRGETERVEIDYITIDDPR